MGDTKFTPGPWGVKTPIKIPSLPGKYYEPVCGTSIIAPHGKGTGLEGLNLDVVGGARICGVSSNEYHKYADNEVCLANAHLIATAPELYKEVANYARDLKEEGYDEAAAEVDALLAKARGEA